MSHRRDLMFDSIKSLAGGGKSAQKAYEDLEALVNAAREEQNALSALLTRVAGQSATLVQTGEALEQLNATAAAAAATADALEMRLEVLEKRTSALGGLEERVQALLAATIAAQRQIEKLTAPDGELEQHRRQTRELSAQVVDAQAAAEAITRERSTFEELRRQLHHSSVELIGIKESVDLGTSLRTDLEHLRAVATQLTRDIDAIRDAAREADDNAFSAAEAVKDMERRLGQMEGLRGLSDTVEERITSLTTLAEHLSQKVQAVDDQKQIIEHAVLETDRLNEIVRKMESHTSTLDGWLSQTERTEERIKQLDQLTAETAARLDVTATVSEEFRASFQDLLAQADELARKQADLDPLREQLALVEEMSARTSADIEAFRRSRADLEALQKQVHEFHHAYTGAAQLRDKLSADRAALESFDERLSSFLARTPELEKTMEGILAGIGRVDEGLEDAKRLAELATELHDHLERANERMEFVRSVEERLDGLRDAASDIDGRLASQLARRGELDALKTQWDDIVQQMAGARDKMDIAVSVQQQLPSIETQLRVLKDRLDETSERVEQLRRTEEEVFHHESRLAEFAAASHVLADSASGRMKDMCALIEELTLSSPGESEVLEDFARVEARQQEALAQAESLEAKMAEFARRSEQIERALRHLADGGVTATAASESAEHAGAGGAPEAPAVTEHHDRVTALRQEMQLMPALLEGVQANLRTVTAQKAMVDQLNGRLANVQFVIEEAQHTLQILNQERALVERIDESIRSLRASRGAAERGGQPA